MSIIINKDEMMVEKKYDKCDKRKKSIFVINFELKILYFLFNYNYILSF